MAFAIRNLSVLAYAQGFTLWHYKADETLRQLAEPGFFDQAADVLTSGDLMMVSAADGGSVLCLRPKDQGIAAVPLG